MSEIIDVMKLIKAVKPRPALYNMNHEHYRCTKRNKFKFWREVGNEVFENWNQLSQVHRAQLVIELKKRWKSLRSCFTRELDLQRKEKIKAEAGEPVKKRKKYEHYHQLQFLQGEDDDSDAGTDSDESNDPLANSCHPDEVGDDYDEFSDDVKHLPSINIDIPIANTQSLIANKGNNQKEDVGVLKHLETEDDEDKYFMLSLVSCFKKMNDEQKMKARIEILKVIQSIAFKEEKI